MADFFGYLNFNRWEITEQIVVTKKENSIKINNIFFEFNISFLPQEKPENHFYYYAELNQLIFIDGKIFLNEIAVSQASELLNLYIKEGEIFLNKISGFFSLIIIDFNKKEIFCANDKSGLNRFYYSYYNNEFKFSSEIKNLINSYSKISKEATLQYLLINHLQDTIFENIHVIKPSSVLHVKTNSINNYKYFNLIDFLNEESKKEEKNNPDDVAAVLKELVSQYQASDDLLLTLTSGYDSRLLLAAALSTNVKPKTFTFGVDNNIEFEIAGEIAKKLKLDYFRIIFDKEFENFLSGYFDYIKETKNIELNFNRYHYFYTWDKIKNEKGIVFTGICGDSFTRDGLSVSYASNNLLYNLIYTENKEKLIKDFIDEKKAVVEAAGYKTKDAIEILLKLFDEIENNNKYKNHFYIKINYVIQKYFASEYLMENKIKRTYPVFLDVRYLQALAKSKFSIFSYKFLDNPNRYKIISHKYYYSLIKILNNNLNSFNTNRGFPLKYSSSLIYLPLRIFYNMRQKQIKNKKDLDYDKWKSMIYTGPEKRFSFEDSLKLKILSQLN